MVFALSILRATKDPATTRREGGCQSYNLQIAYMHAWRIFNGGGREGRRKVSKQSYRMIVVSKFNLLYSLQLMSPLTPAGLRNIFVSPAFTMIIIGAEDTSRSAGVGLDALLDLQEEVVWCCQGGRQLAP